MRSAHEEPSTTLSGLLLPSTRGQWTEALFAALRRPPRRTHGISSMVADQCPLDNDDLQLALWACYELHYRGFADVDEAREWDPDIIRFRAGLEGRFLDALRQQVPSATTGKSVPDRLRALTDGTQGPPLSSYLADKATRSQFEEFVIHKSVYHLKEADPHTWAIPRLPPRPKAALVAIQADEYGSGLVGSMHSELYRETMRALGLNDIYGAFVEVAPAQTLALSNVISLFGLKRSMRGALVGHLAAFEMTSSLPNRRYSEGLRRLGVSVGGRRFFDEHVTADALHEQLACRDLCGGLAAQEPGLADDIVFGAACCLFLDARFADMLLSAWADGHTALRGSEAS